MLLLLLPALAACGASAAPGPAPVAHVAIRNHAGYNEYAYSPATITVRTGTRVVWKNVSSQPHTVTAVGKHPAFDSGTTNLVQPGKSWSHTFRHPGRYHYFCLLHPFMKGTVVVKG